jgi:anaerobic selenocysteine-containing dehydrogenase
MTFTRRELLTLAGGSLLGALFTPVPWKLLDDTAIWTQNWPLIPGLPRGPETCTFTACPLCPGGCALKVRRVNGTPVSMAGVAEHPVSCGILCPAGIAGHHLATHPLRLRQPYTFSGKGPESILIPASAEHVVSEIAKTIREIISSGLRGTIAVLDQRPGRAISHSYQKFLAQFPDGAYIVAPESEDTTLTTLRSLCSFQDGVPGYDFEKTRVILSFGAPLLDGWGTPGRMTTLFQNRKQTGLKLIQAEGVQTRTALQADTWLPVRPGTEALLALAIANTILREGLYHHKADKTIADFTIYKEVVARFHPHVVAELCGISSSGIVQTARTIASTPSIILSGSNPGGGPFDAATEVAIAGLNVLLGNIGREGGICLHGDTPSPPAPPMTGKALANVPDHSLRLLLVDAAESGCTYPTSLLKKKLTQDGGTVVMMTPYLSPRAALADYLVPCPAPFEFPEEVSTPPGARRSSFAMSIRLMQPPETSVDPVAFLATLAAAAGLPPTEAATMESCLRQRVHDIWLSRRGVLAGPEASTRTSLHDISNEEELWKGLLEGGYWIDDLEESKGISRVSLLGTTEPGQIPSSATGGPSLKLIPFGWRNATMTASVAPVMSKLFQESHLRNLGGQVHINPATLAASGLTDGTPLTITTAAGQMTAQAVADPSVIPGIIYAAVGPSPNNAESKDQPGAEGLLQLCTVREDGSWRITDVTIAKA